MKAVKLVVALVAAALLAGCVVYPIGHGGGYRGGGGGGGHHHHHGGGYHR